MAEGVGEETVCFEHRGAGLVNVQVVVLNALQTQPRSQLVGLAVGNNRVADPISVNCIPLIALQTVPIAICKRTPIGQPQTRILVLHVVPDEALRTDVVSLGVGGVVLAVGDFLAADVVEDGEAGLALQALSVLVGDFAVDGVGAALAVVVDVVSVGAGDAQVVG